MGHPRLLKQGLAEIDRRNLTTPAGWDYERKQVIDRDAKKRLWLIHADYWYHYSRAFGSRQVGASYLCGVDEGQTFAVRVPKSVEKITDALQYLTPAAVIAAREKGYWTARQGDIFLVEKKRGENNLDALRWTRHKPVQRVSGRLIVQHPQHATVFVPGSVRAVRAFQGTQVHGMGGD